MVVVLEDSYTYGEIVSFWNPRLRRRIVVLRDPVTKRFVYWLREMYICASCTFESKGRTDHTKNIEAEAFTCVEVTENEWRPLEKDEDFESLIEEKGEQAMGECEDALLRVFAVTPEVAGTSAWSERVFEFARKAHLGLDGRVTKECVYTKEGRRVGCRSLR